VVKELEWMWREGIIPKFEIVSWHVPGGTEEEHETHGIADLGAEVRNLELPNMKQDSIVAFSL
jgi:hypothetical protein